MSSFYLTPAWFAIRVGGGGGVSAQLRHVVVRPRLFVLGFSPVQLRLCTSFLPVFPSGYLVPSQNDRSVKFPISLVLLYLSLVPISPSPGTIGTTCTFGTTLQLWYQPSFLRLWHQPPIRSQYHWYHSPWLLVLSTWYRFPLSASTVLPSCWYPWYHYLPLVPPGTAPSLSLPRYHS